MEISKQDYELFLQFKQFMSMHDNITLSSTKPKKKRREKGTGSITKLSGKRKRPYMATWTTGYNDNDEGQQMQVPLAYFKEYDQADKALDLYMLEKDGRCAVGTVSDYVYNVDGKLSKNCNLINQSAHTSVFDGNNNQRIKDCPTFEEIWKKLLTSDLSHLSLKSLSNYKVSYGHFKDLHKKRIDCINLADLQPYFDELMSKGTGSSKMNNMKIVLNYIFKYAIKYDYIEKNYAQFIKFRETLEEEDKKHKVPFTKEQIKELFAHDDDIIVQSILVMIYTGMRPSELLSLKKENIHINERYMIGGIKTENGIDRVIPIHECIVEYIKNIYNNGLPTHYYQYLYKFNEMKKAFNFECTPHSARHTFATLANEYELNDFLLKKIIGHSAKDLTKDVYTHVDKERLIKEVNKIPTFK
ncbi:MAG: tyrosine-type recombinase/integrase [Longibaculum sp.]